MNYEDLYTAVALVEQSHDHRILHRISPPTPFAPPEGPIHTAIILDTETTGLDPMTAKPWELAMRKVYYAAEGPPLIVGLDRVVSWLQNPGEPLSDEVKRVTGMTDEVLAGHVFPMEEIDSYVSGCNIIIAHNAGYDRKICERHFPTWAKRMNWACSIEDYDWSGISPSRSLECIAMFLGYFYEAHRACADVDTLTAILSLKEPESDVAFFSRIIENAKKPTTRLYAINSPFDAKDRLKARSYKWDANRRVWYRDFRSEVEAGVEALELQKLNLCRSPKLENFTAMVRYGIEQ